MTSTGVKYILENNKGIQASILFDGQRARQFITSRAKSLGARLDTSNGARIVFPEDERKENAIRNSVLRELADRYYMPVIAEQMPCMNSANFFARDSPNSTGSFLKAGGPAPVVTFRLKNVADSSVYIQDQFIHIRTEKPSAVVPVAQRGALAPRFRYCPFPGIRMFKAITVKAHSAVLSSYRPEHVIHYLEKRLPTEARPAFYKCVGQDLGRKASYYHTDQQFDEELAIFDGYQTFREDQPGLDLAVPLIFFYNLALQDALQLTNVDINALTLEIELEAVEKLVEAQIPYAENDTNGVAVPLVVNALKILEFDLWSRKIFVDGFIHELYQNRNFMKMYRDYGYQESILVGDGTSIQITMKHAVESLMVAAQPKANTDSFDKWHIYAFVEEPCLYAPIVFSSGGPNPFDSVGARPFYAKKQIPLFSNAYVSTSGENINMTPDVPAVIRTFEAYAWSSKSCGRYISLPEDSIQEYSWSLKPGADQHSGSVSFSKNTIIEYHWILNPNCPIQPDPATPYRLVLMTANLNVISNQNGSLVRNLTS